VGSLLLLVENMTGVQVGDALIKAFRSEEGQAAAREVGIDQETMDRVGAVIETLRFPGGKAVPLSAVQLLFVNLATDGLPALALAVDPPEPDLMRRQPRDPRKGLFTRPVVTLMLAGGFWSMVVNLALFIWALSSGRSLSESMSMTFASLVLIQFFKAYNFRSDRRSAFYHPFSNRWLNLAILADLLMLLAVVHIPFFQVPFETFSLSLADWLVIAGASFTVFPILELAKWLERHGFFGILD
jgi:Ca2+-transporting ATPase